MAFQAHERLEPNDNGRKEIGDKVGEVCGRPIQFRGSGDSYGADAELDFGRFFQCVTIQSRGSLDNLAGDWLVLGTKYLRDEKSKESQRISCSSARS